MGCVAMRLRSAALLLLLDITVVRGQQASTSPLPALSPSMVQMYHPAHPAR